MRFTAAVCAILLVLACGARRDAQSLAPPPQQTRNAAAIPDPPPPPAHERPRAEHPLYREPRTTRPDDPGRDPAVMPALVHSVAPEYTPEARRARIQGVVILDVIVEKDGTVSAASVLKPLPFGLTEQAVAAVKQWRYAPGKDARGTPMRSIVNVRIAFSLP
jgi:TonB family protein